MSARHEKVQVWIFAEGGGRRHYLLLRYNEVKGGYWQPVTGSVEAGETLEEAALRETREESGFEGDAFSLLNLDYVFEFHSFGKDRRETVFGFRLTWDGKGNPPPPHLSAEHSEFRWCGLEEAIALARWDSNKEGLRRLEAKVAGKGSG